MFSVGLVMPSGLVDPNLLQAKFSVAAYFNVFVLKRRQGHRRGPENAASIPRSCALFPDLADLEIVALNNTIRGLAMVCAADDLELGLAGGHDEFEFYDNFEVPRNRNNNNSYAVNGAYNDAPGMYGSVELASSYPDYASSVLSGFYLATPNQKGGHMVAMKEQLLDAGMAAAKPYGQFVQILTQPTQCKGSDFHDHFGGFNVHNSQQHQQNNQTANNNNNNNNSPNFGFDLYGANSSQPYFNDFRSGSLISDNSSFYGSSLESYASPLDEMFVKKPMDVADDSTSASCLSLGHAETGAHMINYSNDQGKKRKIDFSPLPAADEMYPMYNDEVLPLTVSIEGAKKLKVETTDYEASMRKYSTTSSTSCSFYTKERLPFACTHCSASFKVKSYLTRHMRKHNNANAFICPFFTEEETSSGDARKKNTKCHPTGGFSRRDTFKTHLKALHFIYPPGTKSLERNTMGGRCAGCFGFFESNTEWLKNHIEAGGCMGAPTHRFHDEDSTREVKVEMENC